MNKVKVYRSGIVEAPAQRGAEAPSYTAADAVRPEGRQGRMTGIFAAPTLAGVVRWVRGNHLSRIADLAVREITVDADAVYVYSVREWEKASWGTSKTPDYTAYWESGMTLTEWLAADLDPTEWEILLGAEDVLSVRNVSTKRVMSACEDEWLAKDVKRILGK